MSRRVRRPHASGGASIPAVAEAMECDEASAAMDIAAAPANAANNAAGGANAHPMLQPLN